MQISDLEKYKLEPIKVSYFNDDYDIGILVDIYQSNNDVDTISLADSYNRNHEIKIEHIKSVEPFDDFRYVDYDDEEFNCNLSDEEFDELVSLIIKLGLSELTLAPFRGEDLEKAYKLLKENSIISKEEFLSNFQIRKYESKKDITIESKIKKHTKMLINALKKLNLEKDDIIGTLILLRDETTDEQNDDFMLRLLEYIELKKEFNMEITNSDIIYFVSSLKRNAGIDRYQYLPFDMFVKYIGPSTKELKNGKIYQVAVVYGYDEDYYLVNIKKNKQKEFEASLFEKLQPSKVIFNGSPSKNVPTTEGLDIGKTYDVEKRKGNSIILKNGKECKDYEVQIVDFIPHQQKPLSQLNHEYLHQFHYAFEFGDVHSICKRINDKTVLRFGYLNQEVVGRKNILDYFENTLNRDYLVFAKVVLPNNLNDINLDNGHILLTYPMSSSEYNQCKVYIKTDKIYITEICIESKIEIDG
ncbi:MAG: hypothetical protein E7341_02145 [Clostridiales bacterium]|nr:hypothetical protein [Clostridiales bacterium]